MVIAYGDGDKLHYRNELLTVLNLQIHYLIESRTFQFPESLIFM